MFVQCKNYLWGNTDRQQFENDEQNVDVAPWKNFCGRPWMICFLAFVFSLLSWFTHYELVVSFRSLNFGCKINRINPLLVIILSKLPAITNDMHRLLLWVLTPNGFPELRTAQPVYALWNREQPELPYKLINLAGTTQQLQYKLLAHNKWATGVQ